MPAVSPELTSVTGVQGKGLHRIIIPCPDKFSGKADAAHFVELH